MSEPINPLTLCPHVLRVVGCRGCQALDDIGALSPETADVPRLARLFRRLVVEIDEGMAADLRAELDDDAALERWLS